MTMHGWRTWLERVWRAPRRRRLARRGERRPRLEVLEDRTLPAANLTIIAGPSGAGAQDATFLADNGQLPFTAPDVGADTLSTGALASLGAGTELVVRATQAITFNDLGGTLALPTGAGHAVTFSTAIANGQGISFANTANTVTTAGADLVFSAETGLTVGNLRSAGGAITLGGGSFSVLGTIDSGTGITTLQNSAAGQAIDLGTASAGGIGFTQAELNAITASTLRIGSLTSGLLTVSAAISTPGNIPLALLAGTGITESASGALNVAALRLGSAGPVGLGNGNAVGTLAASTTGAMAFNNGANTLLVGTVDGVGGVTSANSAITLTTDDLLIQSVVKINAGTGTAGGLVTLQPATAGLPITLGTAGVPGTSFGLTDANLGQVSAGLLRIGSLANTGGITVGAPVTRHNGYAALSLLTGGTVAQSATLAAAGLAVQSAGAVTLTSAGNDVDTLAAAVTGPGAGFSFTDANGFALGTVDTPLAGVTTAGGLVTLTAGGPVTQAAGANLTGSQLLLLGSGSFTLGNAGNSVATLAASVAGGLAYTNAGALAIGSINGTTGLSTTGTPLAVVTVAGDLAVSQIVAAGTGAVSLTAGGMGHTLTNSAAVTGAAATLTADHMALAGGTVNVGSLLSSLAVLQPFSAGWFIDLGSATDTTAGTLGISQAELNQVTAGVVRVGSSTSETLNVTAPITAPPLQVAPPTSGNWDMLSLVSGDVIHEPGGPITVGNLIAQGAQGVGLNNVNNQAAVLAGATSAPGAPFSYINATSLGVGGPIDGSAGIATHGGPVTLTVQHAAAQVTVNAPVLSNNGTISLFADLMMLNGSSGTILGAVNAGTGTVTLDTFTSSRPIDVGTRSLAGATLGLTQADLNVVTAGTLQVGNPTFDTGGLTVSAPITAPGLQPVPPPTGNWTTLDLRNTGAVGEGPAASVTVARLVLQGAAGVAFGNLANDAQFLSGTTGGAPFTYRDANALAVDSSDGVSGITTAGGALTVRTVNGNLTVNNAVDLGSAGPNSILLTAGGAGSLFTNNAAVHTLGGDTIEVQADGMALAAGSSIRADGGGRVILVAVSPGQPMNLGAATDPSPATSLNLSNAELNTIATNGVLEIGQGLEGNVTVSAGVSLLAVAALVVDTAGGISAGGPSGTLAVEGGQGALLLEATNSVALPGANSVGLLAAAVTGANQSFTFNNQGALALQIVDGVSGVTTNNGPGGQIVISTTGGGLTVGAGNPVFAGAGNAMLTAGGADQTLTNDAAILAGAAVLSADHMVLEGGTVNVGTGTGHVVSLLPTQAQAVNLGSAGQTAGALNLPQSALNTITTNVLRVAALPTGTLAVTSGITSPALQMPAPAAASWKTLSLAGGTVTQNAAAVITVANLAAAAGAGGVNLNGSANEVGTLSGSTSQGGAFNFANGPDLTIAAADLASGIATSGGSITVVTTVGNLTVSQPLASGSAPIALTVGGGGDLLTVNRTITNTGANPITMTADRMNLAAVIMTGTGRVTLQPSTTTGWRIDLGTATDTAASTLELSNSELNEIQTNGVLQVGNGMSGDIQVTDVIFPASAAVLSLETGGGIGENTGDYLTAPGLALRSVNAVALTGSNNIGMALAASVTGAGQGFTFNQGFGNPLTVGQADGLSGITTAGGDIVVTDTDAPAATDTGTADLTVSQNVTAGSTGAVTLEADDHVAVAPNVVIQSGTGMAGGGPITLESNLGNASGTADVTVGAGAQLLTLGTITINADADGDGTGGGIALGAGCLLAAPGGGVASTISLTAAGDVTVSALHAGTSVRVTSTGGNVRDDGDLTTFLQAPSVNLTAALAVGGAFTISPLDVFTQDDHFKQAIDINTFGVGTQTITQTGAGGNVQVREAGKASISELVIHRPSPSPLHKQLAVIASGDGDLVVDKPLTLPADGDTDLLLAATDGNSVAVDAAVTNAGPTATTALVAAGTGTITGNASESVTGAVLDLETAGGTIGTSAAAPLAITAGTLEGASAGGNVFLAAGGSVAVGSFNAGTGTVVLGAAGTITGMGTGPNITAAALGVPTATGIGTSTRSLTTAISTFAASVGTGGIFLANTGNLSIGTVAGVNGVTAAGGGIHITTTGTLAVSQPVTTATTGANAGDVALAGSGTITLAAALTGSTASVQGGNGPDVIAVQATGPTPLTLNGQGGGDSYRVDLGSLGSPVSVAGTGPGTNALTVIGTAAADTLTVTGTQVSGTHNQVVTYAGVQQLTVDGGDAGNSVTVRGTSVPTALNTGAGNDTITVSSATHTLDTLQGPLTIDAQGGSNSLLVDEGGAAVADTVALTGSSVVSTGVGFTIAYQATGGSFTGVKLVTGSANDTVTVTPSAAVPLTLDGGPSGASRGNTFTFDAAGLPVSNSTGNYTALGRRPVLFSNFQTINVNNASSFNIFYGPDTGDRAAALAGLASAQRFVQVLYLNALGRAGSLAELDPWAAYLSGGGSQLFVAASIEGSLEARDRVVKTWYQTYLGRAAQNGEEMGWAVALGHLSEEQLLTIFLGTGEFYNRAQTLVASPGPDKNKNYVQALYLVLLNRTASDAEVSGWAGALTQSLLARGDVAQAFLGSTEARTDLVEAYYEELLHRHGDAGGVAAYVNSGLDALTLRIYIEASAEFFANG